MKELEIYPSFDTAPRKVYVADSPIDFETWLDLAQTLDTELHRGVIVDRMAAQYSHEWILRWFSIALGGYVTRRKLGKTLGSRTAVKISTNDGRLPDLLFVRAENVAIISEDAIRGVPDLVIEITSKNDRPSDLIPLEADYRTLGVGEIVFIDPRKKRVRLLRKNGVGDYDEEIVTAGRVAFVSVSGFHFEAEWLFVDDMPDPISVAQDLSVEVGEGSG